MMLMSARPESDLSGASPLIKAAHKHSASVMKTKSNLLCILQNLQTLYTHSLIFVKDPQLP